jgi:hypothetical protein
VGTDREHEVEERGHLEAMDDAHPDERWIGTLQHAEHGAIVDALRVRRGGQDDARKTNYRSQQPTSGHVQGICA